jgi:hypothetical protein
MEQKRRNHQIQLTLLIDLSMLLVTIVDGVIGISFNVSGVFGSSLPVDDSWFCIIANTF